MKPAILIEASTVLMFVLAGLSLLVLAVLERQEEGPSRRSALMAMGSGLSRQARRSSATTYASSAMIRARYPSSVSSKFLSVIGLCLRSVGDRPVAVPGGGAPLTLGRIRTPVEQEPRA